MKWLFWALATFTCNGLVLLAQRLVAPCFGKEMGTVFLLGTFTSAAVVCFIVLAFTRRKPTRTELLLGFGAGMISYFGNASLLAALASTQGALVLPIVFGVWILTVIAVSRLIFREPLPPRLAVALVFGLASVVLLAWPNPQPPSGRETSTEVASTAFRTPLPKEARHD